MEFNFAINPILIQFDSINSIQFYIFPYNIYAQRIDTREKEMHLFSIG